MKTKLLTTTILGTLSLSSFAQTLPLPQVQAPIELSQGQYLEGTQTQMTQAEVAQFLPWAQNAQNILTKALKNAALMPMNERLNHIEKSIKSVVQNSGTKNYQMFMRFSLNRGLMLTEELKKEADINEIGVKENILDLLVKSINVALSFYESDLSFQKRSQSGDTSVGLDYAGFGLAYFNGMISGIQNIHDASAEYRLMYKLFEMVNWDLSKDSNAVNYSDAITEIYSGLKELPERASLVDEESLRGVRRLMILGKSVGEIGDIYFKPARERQLAEEKRIQKSKQCGEIGSVDERINDCNQVKGSFALVTKTSSGFEVYKDLKSGLIWGDRLSTIKYMNHYKAQKACNSELAEVGKLSALTWRLPSINEYEEAEKDGIRKVLPNMNDWFWSSSLDSYSSFYARPFDGGNGNTDIINRSDGYDYVSVRCVARE